MHAGVFYTRDSQLWIFVDVILESLVAILAWLRESWIHSCDSCLPNKALYYTWFIIIIWKVINKLRNYDSCFKNLHFISWFQQWLEVIPRAINVIHNCCRPIGFILSYKKFGLWQLRCSYVHHLITSTCTPMYMHVAGIVTVYNTDRRGSGFNQTIWWNSCGLASYIAINNTRFQRQLAFNQLVTNLSLKTIPVQFLAYHIESTMRA